MATNRATEMMLQCVFNGNLSLHDMNKERRPYHRDCDCALHKLKGTVCSNAYCSQKRNVSFPNKKKEQSWSDYSLSMAAVSSKCSSQSPLLNHSLTSVRDFIGDRIVSQALYTCLEIIHADTY